MKQFWQRQEAEARIKDLLDAAKINGPQTVIDPDGGKFRIEFVDPSVGLEKLFSRPGPLGDHDLDP